MKKIDGKTKSVGGLKDISECRIRKLDEPMQEVSVKVIINGKESLISLNDLKELLLNEPKKVINRHNSLEDSLNSEKYLEMYGEPMLREFIDYWTELSINGKKMRYQKEKAFDIGRRLKTWARRDYNALYREHKVQMEKKRQDEYLRQAEKEAYKTPEEQKEKLNELYKGFGKSNR